MMPFNLLRTLISHSFSKAAYASLDGYVQKQENGTCAIQDFAGENKSFLPIRKMTYRSIENYPLFS